MKSELLQYLCCLACKGELILGPISKQDGAGVVDTGELVCGGCGSRYPIWNGIPRLLPRPEELEGHDKRTMECFGYEWNVYRDWGWVKKVPPQARLEAWGSLMEDAETAFSAKTLLTEDDLVGKVVLDAGCGNGRYAFQAAKKAQRVVAFDITCSVDVAKANTDACENIHVVQADLLGPPFRPESFDTIFSIGVLGFTLDAEVAFDSLSRLLRPGGVVAVQFSHRGNVVFELMDNAIRRLSSRLSVGQLMRFAAFMAGIGKVMHGLRIARYANLILRVQPTRHHMFDWYSAARIDRRSYDDVFSWFERRGLEVIAHGKRDSTAARYLRAIVFPWALVVKGRKPVP
ncbi:MAG: methyltransferase domain-containing protein [Candidatus Rokubacteria bacterium]|nr:methyltransferase domain-containing protein [Candidatus Rokubacteria bacterium]